MADVLDRDGKVLRAGDRVYVDRSDLGKSILPSCDGRSRFDGTVMDAPAIGYGEQTVRIMWDGGRPGPTIGDARGVRRIAD